MSHPRGDALSQQDDQTEVATQQGRAVEQVAA
jgi:hypothetical protein